MTSNALSGRVRLGAWALALATGFGVAHVPDAHAGVHFGARRLHIGSSGHDVRVLQSWLTRLGQRTAIDGRYGPRTRRSVRRWETARGRRVNGRLSRHEAGIMRRLVEGGGDAAAPVAPTARATLSTDGRTAVAPADAPAEVREAIAAANKITDRPYRYGGGHGRFRDSAYDCSGSVSFALHGGGLLDSPLDSSGLMRWGKRGRGRWITVYARGGHAFMVIAGLRFDTSGRGEEGPRWRPRRRSGRGYRIRHPEGL